MKYSELVGVDEQFDSTFNVIAERGDNWKTFISNKVFESNMAQIISSLAATEKNERKSFWIQGTYGTGKSHSLSVIKHLLSDDCDSIDDYLPKIQNIQLREKIRNFRKEKRALPVILRGVYAITDSADMMYIIQYHVMRTLEEKGISIAVKSDFSTMVERVNDPKLNSFWESILSGSLKKHVSSKDGIIKRLTQTVPDVSLLRQIIEEFKASGLSTFSRNIDQWLLEVKAELDKQNIADYLIILWDEFTALLDKTERRSILNTLQDIAELSKVEFPETGKPSGIFTYVITHKNLEATEAYKDLKENEKTMAKNRFLLMHYEMQPYTTYHILSAAIQRKNKAEIDSIVMHNYIGKPSVMNVLDNIVENTSGNASEMKDCIISLYPFHPYTAYLSTFVSRIMGSAERSIFEFLHDSNKGFKNFIQNEIEDFPFLTATYVWDFFRNIFEEDTTGKFSPVISKYKMHIDNVTQQSIMITEIFKVILLLNILSQVIEIEEEYHESRLIKPTEGNIVAAFSGIYDPSEVQKCLQYVDEQQIVFRSPDDVFEISFSTLPPQKVSNETKKIYPQYEDVSKIIEFYPVSCQNQINKTLSSHVYRSCKVGCFWAGDKQSTLRKRLTNTFPAGYALNIAAFFLRGSTPELDNVIGRSECSKQQAIDNLIGLSKEEPFKDIIFILPNAELGQIKLRQFVENMARSAVADSLKLPEAEDHKRDAEKWIKPWVTDDIIKGSAKLIFRGDCSESAFMALSQKIADSCLPQIFVWGLEKITAANIKTIWTSKKAKKVVEIVIAAKNRSALESGWSGYPDLRALLLDNSGNYIFNDALELIPNSDAQNPVVHLCQEVNNTIESVQSEPVIDLSRSLFYLSCGTFGYYFNPVSMGALALALRPYCKKMFTSGNGNLIDEIALRDLIICMFDKWENSKNSDEYIIRFSTPEERELVLMLNELFETSEDSLIKVKWAIRTAFEMKNQSPLWSLKYAVNEGDAFNALVDRLFWFVKVTDENIQQKDIDDILTRLKELKIELSQALIKIENSNCIESFLIICLAEVGSSEQELDDLIQFLNQTLNEKKCLWEEDTVHNSVYKWKAQKSMTEQKYPAPGNETQSVSENGACEPRMPCNNGTGTTYITVEKEKVKKTIHDYTGNVEDLKALLLILCDMYPNIVADVESLLNN